MTTAMMVAKERQLDWLLREVLGSETPFAERPAVGHAVRTASRSRWLAAALAVAAASTALGVALLQRQNEAPKQVQQPAEVPWHEAHGPASITSIQADVVNLRCFDFDDAAMAHLPHFAKLERLDLSGMDVNEKGYSVSLKITDAGLAHLAGVPNLRWLSLAGCHDVKGTGLRVLEAMPRLEHLDLTYSGVESPAVERLPNLVSLRSLVLSHCMNFHGRSLAEVAKIPGLRRLELRACTTLAAKDVMHLAKLSELRHLDLRDCQGRFRGQTASGFDDFGGEKPPPPPVQDGIGITDAAVAAVANLPLEALLLGGSESLTDAIGETLAKMTTLRSLDLSDLPKTTGALLANVPDGLGSLALDQNAQFDAADLSRLPRLTTLREFGISGLRLDGATLKTMLEGKQLTALRLGGPERRGKGDRAGVPQPSPRAADAAILAAQQRLESLDLTNALWVDAEVMRQVATLKHLTSLDLTGTLIGQADQLAPLARAASLRRLELVWCQHLDDQELVALAGAPLRELDLYGTNLKDADIRAAAKSWPGCRIKMPKGQLYRVP